MSYSPCGADAAICRQISAVLMAWYAANRRDLPWRHTSDPYRIWVSEIMLQQTQVATVIPYYERFLVCFPTVQSLAAANLDEVLALWQGLGYYARGRNLHAAARRLVAEHGGELPRTRRELLALPGIGDYTAGAILAIAYGQGEPAVDANVVRILARLFDYDRPTTTTAAKHIFREQGRALLASVADPSGASSAGSAQDLTQAMMDLGSSVCTARSPLCGECPLAEHCQARQWGLQEARPIPKVRAPRPHRTFALAFGLCGGRVLLVRRVPRGLLGGLWELPGGQVPARRELLEALAHLLKTHLHLTMEEARAQGSVEHAYSHFSLTAQLYACALVGEPVPEGPWDRAHWLGRDEREEYGLTGLTVKALAALGWPAPTDQR